MVKRFVWIAALVFVAAPALGQTAAEFRNDGGDGIQSDINEPYVDGDACSVVQISKKGNLFMRASYSYAGGDCPVGGRSMRLYFYNVDGSLACPAGSDPDCSTFQDVMFSAVGMFAEPSKRNPKVESKVTLTMSKTPMGDRWYELEFVNELPVGDVEVGVKKITAAAPAEAILYELIDLRPGKKRKKQYRGTFYMPFELTVWR
jgi:hypothetical protein